MVLVFQIEDLVSKLEEFILNDKEKDGVYEVKIVK